MNAIVPGAVIGVIGGGQLGRMLILAGRNLGYRFVVLDPEPNCPAGGVADSHLCAAYTDTEALQRLVEQCDVVTYEFEGLPVESLRWVESRKLLRPSSHVLSICQNRYREKTFLRDHDLPHVPFEVVRSGQALRDALDRLGTPSVLKTAILVMTEKGRSKLKMPERTPIKFFQNWECPWQSSRNGFPIVRNARSWYPARPMGKPAFSLSQRMSIVITSSTARWFRQGYLSWCKSVLLNWRYASPSSCNWREPWALNFL